MARRSDNDSTNRARRASGGQTSSDGNLYSSRLSTSAGKQAGTSRTGKASLFAGKASGSATKASGRTGFSESRLASFLFSDSEGTTASGLSRKYVGLLVFAICVIVFIALRLVYLQVIKAPEYRADALATRTDTDEIRATRGTIYDRRGNVLAISVPAVTIVADPSLIENPVTAAGLLSVALSVDEEWLLEELEYGKEHESRWLYVKKEATLQEASAVKALDLEGMLYIETTRREYPYGEIGGQIIGFCGSDGVGLCGLELYYDDILSAKPGSNQREVGNSGLPIPGAKGTYVAGENGQDIIISIDIELQKELEDALLRAQAQEGATSTSGIVMDASTGEILAIASLPLYDPTGVKDYVEGATTVWDISLTYEPGSTFKTITATSLLEHDLMETTDTVIAPTELHADDKVITDADEREAMIMDLKHVIAVSSNIGIVSSMLTYSDWETLYQDILRYGFTEPTGVDFPGEAEGYLADYDSLTDIDKYNIAFGQGISVTALQMVRFYGALANGGYACTPHFLLKNLATGESPDFGGKQIIDRGSELTDEVTTLLRHVVSEGTSWMADIKGFYVVGKSGTAEIWRGWGYDKNLYNRSFIGYLGDASTPLVCYFCAQDVPYEGSVAPTFFKTIMQEAIERYRVTSQWDGKEKDTSGVGIPL